MKSLQAVGHLVGSVIGQRHAQQIRYLLPEIVVVKPLVRDSRAAPT
jgi:hypothetical protein